MNSGKIPGSPSSQTELTSGKRSGSASTSSSTSGDLRAKAGDVTSRITDTAQQAMDEVKRSGTALASEANERVKGLLDQQVTAGADLVSHVADSARMAADNLDQNVPQLASLVRDASQRIDEFSRQIRSQSAADLAHSVSDFARRRPAVVFGMGAALGFVAFRLLNASAPRHRYVSGTDHDRTGRTDWRPEPRLGGSAYPVSTATPPAPRSGPSTGSGLSGSTQSSPTPLGAGTQPSSTSPGLSTPSTPTPPGGSPLSPKPSPSNPSTQSSTTAPGGSSTFPSVSGDASPPISPQPGRFHGS